MICYQLGEELFLIVPINLIQAVDGKLPSAHAVIIQTYEKWGVWVIPAWVAWQPFFDIWDGLD